MTYIRKHNAAKSVAKPKKSKAQLLAETAYKGLRIANSVKNMINVEKKYYVGKLTATQADYDGDIQTFFNPVRGDASDQRVGASLLMKRITMRGFVQETGGFQSFIRVILFRDKCDDITTGAQLLEETGSTFGVLTKKKHDTRNKTVILYDKLFNMNDARSTQLVFDYTLNNVNKHVTFNDGASQPSSNVIKICFITTETPANKAARSPKITIRCMTEYIDN